MFLHIASNEKWNSATTCAEFVAQHEFIDLYHHENEYRKKGRALVTSAT
jgi:hypothetical protein